MDYILDKRERCALSHTWVLELARGILSNIESHIRSARSRVANEIAALDDSNKPITKIAIGLAPEAFGLAQVYNRMPYTNPEHLKQGFKSAVDRGWLTIVREGVYRATDKSQRVYDRICQDLSGIYRGFRTLPEVELNLVEATLDKVIGSIRDDETVGYKPAFDLDVKLAKNHGCTLGQICCQLSHLLAYRDDAYVAAWMEQEVNSYVWEAYSYIYKGIAQNSAQLATRLGIHRYYDEPTYAEAITELEARGWIMPVNGGYEPSAKGLTVLAQVARTMSHYFSVPWLVLDEDEVRELREGLEDLTKSLEPKRLNAGYGHADVIKNIEWGAAMWARDKTR